MARLTSLWVRRSRKEVATGSRQYLARASSQCSASTLRPKPTSTRAGSSPTSRKRDDQTGEVRLWHLADFLSELSLRPLLRVKPTSCSRVTIGTPAPPGGNAAEALRGDTRRYMKGARTS